MSEILLSIAETQKFEEVSRATVYRRIEKGTYLSREVPSVKQLGKTETKVVLSSLLLTAQKAYWKSKKSVQAEPVPSAVTQKNLAAFSPGICEQPGEVEIPGYEEQSEWLRGLSDEHKQEVRERLDFIEGFEKLCPVWSRERNKGLLLEQYCKGLGLSVQKYYRLKKMYDDYGRMGLRNMRYGQTRSLIASVPELRDYIIALIVRNPFVKAARVHQNYLPSRFPKLEISAMSVGRFMNGWKDENKSVYQMLVSPDQWKNLFMVSFGNASEKAKHFGHFWEMDSSPADVICSDGKRYSLIGCLDVFSRKCKILVVPTSNSRGIAALIRLCILDWGIPDNIVIDNGKDYTSNHVKEICELLNIALDIVPPFCPEKKPHIERFYKTLSWGLFEELQGYIGHCVADRKKIESQKSFASRMNKKDEVVEIKTSRENLQKTIALWLDSSMYHHKEHSGKGMKTTPERKAASTTVAIKKVANVRVLDLLLNPSVERVVSKDKGIQFDGRHFVSTELSNWPKRPVRIQQDYQEAGKIYVFTKDWKFICDAYDRSLGKMSTADYSKMRKAQKKDISEKVKALKTLVKATPMAEHLSKKEANKVAALKVGAAVETPYLIEAGKGVLGEVGVKPDHLKTVAEIMEDTVWEGSNKETTEVNKKLKLRIVHSNTDDVSAEPEYDGSWLDNVTVVNK